MKKRWLVALCLILLVLAMHLRPVLTKPATSQQRASHMLSFYSYNKGLFGTVSGRSHTGQCTGTAVGPHAIMTALHCDEYGESRVVRLDMSRQDYHIINGISDGRDHLILLIDGPALQYYVPLEKLTNVRPVTPSDHMYIYGNGGGRYPSFRRDGQLATKAQLADASELDQRDGMSYYTFPTIPGDSGSAVFASDGRVVGVVTYGWVDDDSDAHSAGFALNYTREQIILAETFDVALVAAPQK